MQNMRTLTHSSKVALRIGEGGGGVIQLLQVVCTMTETQQEKQRDKKSATSTNPSRLKENQLASVVRRDFSLDKAWLA